MARPCPGMLSGGGDGVRLALEGVRLRKFKQISWASWQLWDLNSDLPFEKARSAVVKGSGTPTWHVVRRDMMVSVMGMNTVEALGCLSLCPDCRPAPWVLAEGWERAARRPAPLSHSLA